MSDQISTLSLQMAWSQAPWDQVVCGFPVLQITSIVIQGKNAATDLNAFERERDRLGAGMVSCRLPHECLKESMLLEDRDFRFIEMVYAPELALSSFKLVGNTALLAVAPARESDLPFILDTARTSFSNERFKMDPRLDPDISDQRYRNWAASSLHHAAQNLHVVCDGKRKVAFFVTEMQGDGTCYWHLNAVAPDAQGQGYGRRAWLSMLDLAEKSGAKRVRTSVVARNHRVLNLYARLGFYFPPPSMTFHWVRSKPE